MRTLKKALLISLFCAQNAQCAENDNPFTKILHIVTQQGEPRNSPIMKHFQVEELGPLRRVCKAWNAITPVPDNEKADFLWNNLKKEKKENNSLTLGMEELIKTHHKVREECNKAKEANEYLRNQYWSAYNELKNVKEIHHSERNNYLGQQCALEKKLTDATSKESENTRQFNQLTKTHSALKENCDQLQQQLMNSSQILQKKHQEILQVKKANEAKEEENKYTIRALSTENISLEQKKLKLIALSASVVGVWALDSLVYRSKIHSRLQTFNSLMLTKVFHLKATDSKYKTYNNIMTIGSRVLFNAIGGGIIYTGLLGVLKYNCNNRLS